MPTTMTAIVQDRYGPLDRVLELAEVDRPTVEDGEVLVRVHAASIHVGDVFVAKGVPYLFRPAYGLRRPKQRIPGTDIAGTVEAVGPKAGRFKPGDAVFGWCSGAFAEYAAVAEDALAPMPADLTFEEAAALGVSAMTALQALRDQAGVRPGQKVLVNGASGGVGTFAVQIAKSLGAEVTGVCSTRSVELVRSLGADRVIDYTRQDFTNGGERYDVILDNVGNHSLRATRRALAPDGILLANGSDVGGWLGGIGRPIKAMVSSIFVRQQGRPFLSMPTAADLFHLKELAESGRVRPVIDRTYPLVEGARAMLYVAERHAQGTTVITAAP
jgi:NADPH:quinone reductase-like Zn-dependent oxidoreductase